MKSYPLDALDKHPLNQQLQTDSTHLAHHLEMLCAVKAHLRVEVFEDKEYIIRANEPLTRLYLLLSGRAKIAMLHEDGYTAIIYFVKPNEMIGELSLISVETTPKDVISIGQSICLSLPLEATRETLLADNNFLLQLSRFIGTKLLDRTWFNAKQQHYDLRHRLAAYILLCEVDGRYSEPHVQTADYLAVSYRHLMHTFKEFREQGLITKVQGVYTFNRSALEALAQVMQ